MNADDWGIPTLDPSRQAVALTPPVWPYGSVGRGRQPGGTVHFYTADNRFTRLFANPGRLLMTGCVAAFETNCSTGPGIPRAVALHGIYRKRAAAAHWQSQGLDIVVDLNVDDGVLDLALLGVPRGWRSYATRAHRGDSVDDHARRHRMAVWHADGQDVVFTVVGGGKRTRAICEAHGWLHVPEHCRAVRGLEVAHGAR